MNNPRRGNQQIQEGYAHYAKTRMAGGFRELGSWSLVLPFLQHRKVLDIGCSDGLYLRQLRRDSVGIERIPALVEAALASGLNVIQGEAMDVLAQQPPQSYEAVLLSHVMEHLERPIDALREINRVLIPGGTAVVGLPTEHNVFRSVRRYDYFSGTHLYAFSVRNAQTLLTFTGFAVDQVFFHLPLVRGSIGGTVHRVWKLLPIPFKEYLSMAYWLVAIKATDDGTEHRNRSPS